MGMNFHKAKSVFLTIPNHHFFPLEERDTAYDYRNYWMTEQGSPT